MEKALKFHFEILPQAQIIIFMQFGFGASRRFLRYTSILRTPSAKECEVSLKDNFSLLIYESVPR